MVSRPKPGVQERILLHLSDFADFMNSVEVPFDLSQMGIENAVAMPDPCSTCIAGLKDQGLLIERKLTSRMLVEKGKHIS